MREFDHETTMKTAPLNALLDPGQGEAMPKGSFSEYSANKQLFFSPF